MGQVIGDLLPLAVGVAISPVPIIAVILMLLAPKAGAASAGFALGWVIGIVVVTVLFISLTSSTSNSDGQPSDAASWIKLVLGLLLLLFGAKEWRGRPKPGADVPLPKWMAAVDQVTPLKAVGLGALLSGVNPKNLLLCGGAGATIGAAGLDSGDQTICVAVFTIIAASTVLIPVIGYAVAKDRLRQPLQDLKVWLQANNATVMAVLILVIGVALFGKGLGGLI